MEIFRILGWKKTKNNVGNSSPVTSPLPEATPGPLGSHSGVAQAPPPGQTRRSRSAGGPTCIERLGLLVCCWFVARSLLPGSLVLVFCCWCGDDSYQESRSDWNNIFLKQHLTSQSGEIRNACVAGDSATMHLIGVSLPSCYLLRSEKSSLSWLKHIICIKSFYILINHGWLISTSSWYNHLFHQRNPQGSTNYHSRGIFVVQNTIRFHRPKEAVWWI